MQIKLTQGNLSKEARAEGRTGGGRGQRARLGPGPEKLKQGLAPQEGPRALEGPAGPWKHW